MAIDTRRIVPIGVTRHPTLDSVTPSSRVLGEDSGTCNVSPGRTNTDGRGGLPSFRKEMSCVRLETAPVRA